MNVSRRGMLTFLFGGATGVSLTHLSLLLPTNNYEIPQISEESLIQLFGLGLLPLDQIENGDAIWISAWNRLSDHNKMEWLLIFANELANMQYDSNIPNHISWSEKAIAGMLSSTKIGGSFSVFVSTVYRAVFDIHEFVEIIYGADYRATNYADPDFL